METWLRETFPETVSNGDIIIFRGTSTDGVRTWDYVIAYNPSNAANDFPAVSPVPTHAALSALGLAKTGNWQRIFDDWKAKGMIA